MTQQKKTIEEKSDDHPAQLTCYAFKSVQSEEKYEANNTTDTYTEISFYIHLL